MSAAALTGIAAGRPWSAFQETLAHVGITAGSPKRPQWIPETDESLLPASAWTLNDVTIHFQAWWEHDNILLHYAGIGQFWISSGGGHIQYVPEEPQIEVADEIISWVLTSVLPVALQAHGAHCLHASCVSVAGDAALFMGESGAGKSTLAASCITAGAELIGDDLTPVIVRDGLPTVIPLASSLNLVSDMAGNWLDSVGLASTYITAFEKHVVPVHRLGGTPAQTIFPLRGAFLLERSAPESSASVRIEPLMGHRLGAALLANSYLGPWLPLLGLEHAWLEQIDALSRSVPVSILHYGNGPDALAEAQAAVFQFLEQQSSS